MEVDDFDDVGDNFHSFVEIRQEKKWEKLIYVWLIFDDLLMWDKIYFVDNFPKA